MKNVSTCNKKDKSSIDLAEEMNNQDTLEILCPNIALDAGPEYL